jgi:hypothetical protein
MKGILGKLSTNAGGDSMRLTPLGCFATRKLKMDLLSHTKPGFV